MNTPKPQEIYRHFKGNLYQVLSIATHSETEEQMVVYQALYGDYKVYVRPLDSFISPVDRAKYPDAKQLMRFERLGSAGDGRTLTSGNASVCGNASVSGNSSASVNTSDSGTGADTSDYIYTGENMLDPVLDEFLEAKTCEKRLELLESLHARLDDNMLTAMEISCDIALEEGTIEERYRSLKNALLTRDKYECNRLR